MIVALTPVVLSSDQLFFQLFFFLTNLEVNLV